MPHLHANFLCNLLEKGGIVRKSSLTLKIEFASTLHVLARGTALKLLFQFCKVATSIFLHIACKILLDD